MEDDRSGKRKQSPALVEFLTRKTYFNLEEIRSLLLLYAQLTTQGKMDRLRFREFLYTTFDITEDLMLDRIYRVFDTNNDTIVDEKEWVEGLSIFLRGTLEDHIHFCYSIYDMNGDSALAREELFHCLKNSLIRAAGMDEDIEESIKDIVEITLKKLDLDKNGKITFEDFKGAVNLDPLLLEFCGQCLPAHSNRNKFLETFLGKCATTNSSSNIHNGGKIKNGKEKEKRIEMEKPKPEFPIQPVTNLTVLKK